MEHSDYKQRGYAGLHIKTETRQRLNLVAAQMRSEHARFISQDEALNLLIDRYAEIPILQEATDGRVKEI